MQDAIDKRNERERIAHSIVKRWNVHYMSEEEILAARKKQQDEQQAQEILDRLARVAAEEEEKKQREIDAAVRQKIEEERARLQKEEADEKGTTTVEDIQEMISKAVNEAMEPVLKSVGIPTNLDNEGEEIKKTAEHHYMEGVF